jgi:hypothetical protein
MKKSTLAILAAAALGASGLYVIAQADGPSQGDHPKRNADNSGQAGPQARRPMPPRHPLEVALDANGDGIISADEIANAAAALKALDKNGDGQLTPEEYRPRFPGHGARPPGGPGNGQNGPDNQNFGPGPGFGPPPPPPDDANDMPPQGPPPQE